MFYFVFLNTQNFQEQRIGVEYRYVEQVVEWQVMYVIDVSINFEWYDLMVVLIDICDYYD
jgi:hypothetical protein